MDTNSAPVYPPKRFTFDKPVTIATRNGPDVTIKHSFSIINSNEDIVGFPDDDESESAVVRIPRGTFLKAISAVSVSSPILDYIRNLHHDHQSERNLASEYAAAIKSWRSDLSCEERAALAESDGSTLRTRMMESQKGSQAGFIESIIHADALKTIASVGDLPDVARRQRIQKLAADMIRSDES